MCYNIYIYIYIYINSNIHSNIYRIIYVINKMTSTNDDIIIISAIYWFIINSKNDWKMS